jgi:hypothetical protein
MNQNIKVILSGFRGLDMKDGKVLSPIRNVEVSLDTDATVSQILSAVYNNGQNDIQPGTTRSVSVGDIICLPDGQGYHLVAGFGFLELSTYGELTDASIAFNNYPSRESVAEFLRFGLSVQV